MNKKRLPIEKRGCALAKRQVWRSMSHSCRVECKTGAEMNKAEWQ